MKGEREYPSSEKIVPHPEEITKQPKLPLADYGMNRPETLLTCWLLDSFSAAGKAV